MNVFEVVKKSVTAKEAAQYYGVKVSSKGMARCPFHNDKSPSMKVDDRFFCFGCHATGDAVDLVSRLFNIPCRDAAIKIVKDFRLQVDLHEHPIEVARARDPTEDEVLGMQIRDCYEALAMYREMLLEWKQKYAPKQTDEKWDPAFVEAIQREASVEYMMDFLLTADAEEIKKEIGGIRNEVMKFGCQ